MKKFLLGLSLIVTFTGSAFASSVTTNIINGGNNLEITGNTTNYFVFYVNDNTAGNYAYTNTLNDTITPAMGDGGFEILAVDTAQVTTCTTGTRTDCESVTAPPTYFVIRGGIFIPLGVSQGSVGVSPSTLTYKEYVNNAQVYGNGQEFIFDPTNTSGLGNITGTMAYVYSSINGYSDPIFANGGTFPISMNSIDTGNLPIATYKMLQAPVGACGGYSMFLCKLMYDTKESPYFTITATPNTPDNIAFSLTGINDNSPTSGFFDMYFSEAPAPTPDYNSSMYAVVVNNATGIPWLFTSAGQGGFSHGATVSGRGCSFTGTCNTSDYEGNDGLNTVYIFYEPQGTQSAGVPYTKSMECFDNGTSCSSLAVSSIVGNFSVANNHATFNNNTIFNRYPYFAPTGTTTIDDCTNGVCRLVANASSTFMATVGFTPAGGVKFAGDNFIKPIIGGGLSLFTGLMKWVIVMAILSIVIFFSYRAFKFYGKNARSKVVRSNAPMHKKSSIAQGSIRRGSGSVIDRGVVGREIVRRDKGGIMDRMGGSTTA